MMCLLPITRLYPAVLLVLNLTVKSRMFLTLFIFFFLMIRRPPISTLFPYTALFRSSRSAAAAIRRGARHAHPRPLPAHLSGELGGAAARRDPARPCGPARQGTVRLVGDARPAAHRRRARRPTPRRTEEPGGDARHARQAGRAVAGGAEGLPSISGRPPGCARPA